MEYQKVLTHVLEEAGYTKDSNFTLPDFVKVSPDLPFLYWIESVWNLNVWEYGLHQSITSMHIILPGSEKYFLFQQDMLFDKHTLNLT
jgi:hypothetical protein